MPRKQSVLLLTWFRMNMADCPATDQHPFAAVQQSDVPLLAMPLCITEAAYGGCCRCRVQLYSDLRSFFEMDRLGVYKGPGERFTCTLARYLRVAELCLLGHCA